MLAGGFACGTVDDSGQHQQEKQQPHGMTTKTNKKTRDKKREKIDISLTKMLTENSTSHTMCNRVVHRWGGAQEE